MRLEVLVDSPWRYVPKAYAFLPVAMFKDGLARFDESKVFEIYTWQGKANKRIKPFCWALRFASAPKVEGDKMFFEKPFKLVFSTPNIEFLNLLARAFVKLRSFVYRDVQYDIVQVSTREHKPIASGVATFRTLSPINIRDEGHNDLSPQSPGFNEHLNYVQNLIFMTWEKRELRSKLLFEPLNMKKRIVPILESEGKTIFIEGYIGTFKLTGDAKDLNLIQQYGIGFRRSQGFGCIEVVEG